MSTVYKRERYWWAWGYDAAGKRWRQSTKVPVDQPKAIARKLARDLERRILLEGTAPPQETLGDALEELRAAKVRRCVSAATMEQLAYKGNHLRRIIGPRTDIHAIDLATCERFLDQRVIEGVKLLTVYLELSILREALRLAAKHDRYRGNVQAIWPDALRNAYQPRTRWLTWAEWTDLMAVAPPHRHDYLTAYVHLGVRFSELYKLEARHLDHEARAVFVDGTKTRAAKRWVPCDDDVWPVLTARAKEHRTGPLFPQKWERSQLVRDAKTWARWVAVWRAKAAKEDHEDPRVLERHRMAPWSTNDLRRTFASWLCQAGAPELDVTRLMGHTSSAMVRRVYAQLSRETLRRAIDRLPTRVTADVTRLHATRWTA